MVRRDDEIALHGALYEDELHPLCLGEAGVIPRISRVHTLQKCQHPNGILRSSGVTLSPSCISVQRRRAFR